MIILTLRTDKPESELALFDNDRRLSTVAWQAHRQLGETIHLKIDELLKANDKTWQDIDGIIAYEGPGSFTGLRIGLSVANALAHAVQAPIVALGGDDWEVAGRAALMAGHDQKVALPHYGAPVHITQPKH